MIVGTALLSLAWVLVTACGAPPPPPAEETTAPWTAGEDAPLEEEPE